MSTQTGGAAFPTGTGVTPYNPGMTLRDYFAAKAMQGMIANPALLDRGGNFSTENFTIAYAAADAMLKARK